MKDTSRAFRIVLSSQETLGNMNYYCIIVMSLAWASQGFQWLNSWLKVVAQDGQKVMVPLAREFHEGRVVFLFYFLLYFQGLE